MTFSRPGPMTRRIATALIAVLTLGALAGCSFGASADRDGLMTSLQEVTGLTAGEAQCSVDLLEENADYAKDVDGNLVSRSEVSPGNGEVMSFDEVLTEVADGESDVDGLVPAFERDLAQAVSACT